MFELIAIIIAIIIAIRIYVKVRNALIRFFSPKVIKSTKRSPARRSSAKGLTIRISWR